MTEAAPELLVDGLGFGEGPRWHDGRLFLSDLEVLELLGLVGRRARHVEVRSVSARAAFIPLLVALSDGLQDVQHEHCDMVVSRTAG